MEPFSGYFKKDNILSRVDARIKILTILAILIMVISYKGIAFSLLVTLLCLLFCLRMKIPLRVLILRFLEPAVIVSVILCVKIFFTGYKNGLADGLIIASRIFGAVSLVVLLGFSTPFTEFMAGLLWFKAPKGFIEILMFAYRYIFMLLDDALVIYNAQKNRLGFSNISRGLNSFGIMSASLVLKAFQQSQNITLAMLQRGYTGNTPITAYPALRKSEIRAAILIIAVMGILWKIK